MAKGKKKKGGRRRTTLSLTAAAWIIFLLNRLGVAHPPTIAALMEGDFETVVAEVSAAVEDNFTGAGAAVTIAGSIALTIVTAAVKFAGRGKTVPLTGRITALSP